MTRRRFVRWGVAGAVLLGLGGVFAWQSSGYRVSDETRRRLRALSPKELLVVRAVASRLLRPDGPDFPTPDEVETAEHVDALVAELDAASRDDLRKLLHAVEHAIPWMTGRASRFTRLDDVGRDAVLASMMNSRVPMLRGAFDALKSVCALAYFRDERTWGPLGYDGPLVGRPLGGFARFRRGPRAGSTPGSESAP